MLLGGSHQQVIAIDTAKEMGIFTVLCDYLDDNPGQYHADRFYLASSTDKELVLRIAREEQIDGILAYASDPAAPTAAYVAEELGLPGSPYESVEILCNKDRFRKFLSEHGFCTPQADGYSDCRCAERDIVSGRYKLPVIVKPVDSSGSKGVSRIDAPEDIGDKLVLAMERSRCKRIIVEEYVTEYGYQVAGDGLSIDGKLVFRYFGNDHFDRSNSVNPFVPISASFPYNMPVWVQDKIHAEIQRLLDLLHMRTNTYNFDIRIDKDYNVYLMEIAPRDGGNYIPDLIRYATGVDLIRCSVLAALGEPIDTNEFGKPHGFCSYYAIHSGKSGHFDHLEFAPGILENHVIEQHIKKAKGDTVNPFMGANNAVGILLMRFDSMEQMLYMMDHGSEWIHICLEEE